jgi:hypothetical protein
VTSARNTRSRKLETAATYVTDRMRRVSSSMRFFETKSTIRARFTDTPHARSFAWRELKAADWDTHILKIRELENDWQNNEARAKQLVAPE